MKAGLSIAIAGLLLAACGGGDDPASPSTGNGAGTFSCELKRVGTNITNSCIQYKNLDAATAQTYKGACSSGTIGTTCPAGATLVCPGDPAFGITYETHYYFANATCR